MEHTQLRLGYHLVAFLDVLGQRERFKQLHLPKTPQQHEEVAEVLRQTAGFVLELRKTFANQFATFEMGLVGLKTHAPAPVCPKFVGFSDSFVTSVPLHNESSHLTSMATVFSALTAAAVVMMTALASKHALRGGIDVGLATEIVPGEIYGTALERAYVLESKEAGYPRIVIGDELWNYLNVAKANFQIHVTPESKAIVAMIDRLLLLIAVDADGRRVLDYLGPVLSELQGTDDNFKVGMVQPLYAFVLAERERVISNGDAKLITRYDSFRQYVESRLHLWNLQKM
ncbi:hypothetical protein [Terriglobus saanensis]|uniref:Uncharacterized protein n=1 Tax=Terriglobus saanensis (strain ATCC BAA-1853 / DSM 23119 / SP1PR4) TaxID=401053 RepID=E8V4D7_TERSS|nr:hypothetical protein [Terriglobus saanensis]ADV83686.1 hypothetical protein AciPR4_2926 [Terriglobus saanensis SP1PR4]